ncbi:diaminopimelate decarboxylase [Vallitalea okinawensis]|uniref:diaminopimelate decarboxylase n=1 Tax=Vallitalea okinawensis TaxID=2078660 RepID=UPI000CFC5E4E|nr:diaminopimelate decarboxylase [Vallitalea okinawensis]
MQYAFNEVTNTNQFYGNTTPIELVKEFGSPLYVYNEAILRERCKELKSLINYDKFTVNYSVKANGNLHLLKVARDEGLNADAMSPGEIFVELEAGFTPDQILYISNNVSAEEMQYAIDRNITVSVDSLSQLELYGKTNPGGKVCIRFNPGVGAGHHEKVVTGGKKTKFGVDPALIPNVKAVLEEYDLKLIGINQHIGSLFMDSYKYIEGIKSVLAIAENFADLEFVDFGGGFGIPYRKQYGERRLDLNELGTRLEEVIKDWMKRYGKDITVKVEPGRYISAECGVLLGTAHAVKHNYGMKYVGTDLGFNVLKRPVMYDSHHDVEIYREEGAASGKEEVVNIVGNICESGDIIANQRKLPEILEGDIIGVLDAGAYGYCMSSNYNNRLRPAEVLIDLEGNPRLIRKRDTLEDLLRGF